MSEESLTSQDKEELKRRLQLLQKEYERTALRLQRAERREAVCKHVQNTMSKQNRVLVNTSPILEQNSSSPELLSTHNLSLNTTKVRFHLPDSSPFSTITCRRSPSRTHRLRSRRSRLRLQVRERESDTEESQEITTEEIEGRRKEEREEIESECQGTRKDKEKDTGRRRTEEGRKLDEEKTETLKDELNLTSINHLAAAECCSVSQSAFAKFLEVKEPRADQSADRNSPSASYRSNSSDHSNPSLETLSQSCTESINGSEICPGSADFINSCTVIEGLPFPVEYYIRTTRRMASAHSSVDLNAVILSQLSNGRGRRRSLRGHGTPQSLFEKPPEKSRCKKPGRRGRRGRRRAHESDSSSQLDALLQSPSSLLQEEFETIPSPKSSSNTAPGSLLHFSSKQSPDSQVHPILRKMCGHAGVSHPQVPANVNDSSHLLPSLASLAQALRANLGSGPLMMLDVQDFHLPDDEFGVLKLERLRSSSGNAISLTYNTCFRKIGGATISVGGQAEHDKVVVDSLPHCATLQSSLPFTSSEWVESGNMDQSEHKVTQEPEELLQQDRDDYKHTQKIKPNDPHTHSASTSLMLNLSMSQTSRTQTPHNPMLISLGMTPNMGTACSSSESTPLSFDASKQSEVEVNNGIPENEHKRTPSGSVSVNLNEQVPGRDITEHSYCRSYTSNVSQSQTGTHEPVSDVLMNSEEETHICDRFNEINVMLVNVGTHEPNTEIHKLTDEILIYSETESQSQIVSNLSRNEALLSKNDPPLLQIGAPPQNEPPLSQNGRPLSQTDHHPQNGLPLSQNNLPVSQNDHNPQNDPPLSQTNPLINQTSSILSQNNSPLSQTGEHPQNNPHLSKFCLFLSQKDLHLSQNNPLSPPYDSALSQKDRPLTQSDAAHFQNDHIQSNSLLPQNDPLCLHNDQPNGSVLSPDPDEVYLISKLDFGSQIPSNKMLPCGNTDSGLNKQAVAALPGVSDSQGEDNDGTFYLNLNKTCQPQTGDSQHMEVLHRGALQKTHTLKALDEGCVLDVCLVRWPTGDWCVCVAGEWSVCVWKQNAGVQQWSLLYTWTFTQSVISLQGIPDSSLLCVCLGKLEIIETRILYCPSTRTEFFDTELYKGALQAVLAVSDLRVTCCSAPGPQQIQVFTLTQDGRAAETVSLVSSSHTIQTLVVVEKERDALIGWTEQNSLIIWNMKSGQLLQTIHLMETVSTATCLRGYSSRGVLYVLLQRASACHEETASELFTLIATNPLTGKYFTRHSIRTPSAPTQRLIDGDVCESALVGVFQSGITIWNLTGGVACTYANEPAEACRLARWAGPNTLLTGYLSGDVDIYQFQNRENRTELTES